MTSGGDVCVSIESEGLTGGGMVSSLRMMVGEGLTSKGVVGGGMVSEVYYRTGLISF